ncbi:MAG TPA: hypothetical protein PLI05_03345 [Methanotrichaceae archaeon]|nr:hypothetical protein [Methanotrichaceae archaeon]HQF16087.1 hypothetical protein [Methanotrichaceae archaeon]HQI90797.1 hypothetical protein [Methanotrichaceae archaeon]HQJ28246.1 hypothetical protein [Methanotrichaceae archaeon]
MKGGHIRREMVLYRGRWTYALHPVSHPPYPPQIDIYFTNLYLVNLIYGALTIGNR